MIFINKLDTAAARVRDVLAALQSYSDQPLVLRQVPLRSGDGEVTGYVDLVSERAYTYRPGHASDLVPLPADFWNAEGATRTQLVEKLADFDDALLEQLLEDVQPPKEEIYQHLTKDFQKNLIVPVFVGAATPNHGVRRLWKALRHETPSPQETAARLGIAPEGEPMAQVFKTYHLPHTGKLSLSRVWRGAIAEGNVLNGVRVAGVVRLLGAQQEKAPSAQMGEVVGRGAGGEKQKDDGSHQAEDARAGQPGEGDLLSLGGSVVLSPGVRIIPFDRQRRRSWLDDHPGPLRLHGMRAQRRRDRRPARRVEGGRNRWTATGSLWRRKGRG